MTTCTKLKVLKLNYATVSFAGITGLEGTIKLDALTRLEAHYTNVGDDELEDHWSVLSGCWKL